MTSNAPAEKTESSVERYPYTSESIKPHKIPGKAERRMTHAAYTPPNAPVEKTEGSIRYYLYTSVSVETRKYRGRQSGA
jgi:hypothetical protein